jgi:hypothetical protein
MQRLVQIPAGLVDTIKRDEIVLISRPHVRRSLFLITVKLAPSEFYWAAVCSTTQQMRKVFVLFGFVGFLSLTGLIFATLFSQSFNEWQQTIRGMYLPLFAFVCILPILVVFLAPLFSLGRFLADPGNAAGARFRFSESGVVTERSVGKTDCGWTIYLKAQETLHYFLLYPSSAEAQVIPKRCLSTSGELEHLRDLFRRHISRNNLKFA